MNRLRHVSKAFEKCKTKLFRQIFLGILWFVLECNTMKYGHFFYYQTEGCVMGTLMDPTFENTLVTNFAETQLADFKSQHGHGPIHWLRCTSYVSFSLEGTPKKNFTTFFIILQHFCAKTIFNRNIKFPFSFSKNAIERLDTRLKLSGFCLLTELFCKPTSSH